MFFFLGQIALPELYLLSRRDGTKRRLKTERGYGFKIAYVQTVDADVDI